MENLSDAQLVQATHAGNKKAFGIIAERYYEMVLRIAYRMIGQRDIARDIAQKALLQAFLSLKQLRDPSCFRGWLYGITLNVCRDFLRIQRVDLISLEALAGGIYIPANTPSPEAIVEQIELRQKVQQAVQSLSESNRAVVMLYYYEGLGVRDVSQILDISVSAVKGRLHKARQQLKRYLEAVLPTIERKIEGVSKMIPVTVVDVMSQTYNDADGHEFRNYQVVLFDESSRRALVIWIGESEAITIAAGIAHESFASNFGKPSATRPMTQQFIMSLIQAVGATAEAIELSKLENNIFFATVRMKTDAGMVKEVDARPSDALGLAVWHDIPVYVSPEVWEKASPPLPDGLKATQKGVNAIFERLREEGTARQSWVTKMNDEWTQDSQDPDMMRREAARGIIDAVFE